MGIGEQEAEALACALVGGSVVDTGTFKDRSSFNQAASLFLSFFFPLECTHRPKVVFDLSTALSPKSAVMPDTQ